MKSRFPLLVCLLLIVSLPAAAQTLTMADGWSQTVTAQAQNVTAQSAQSSQTLNPNGSWNTGMPANRDTEEKIAFVQGSQNLANTPILISGVLTAKLVFNATYGVLVVQLTPSPSGKKHQHDIDEANAFLAMKVPTKEFCLLVTRLSGKRLQLANGMIVLATGNLAVLPKEGESGCVCGRGLLAEPGTYMERFEAKSHCPTAKK